MNKCLFFGRLVDDPLLEDSGLSKVVTINILVETFRKANNLDKKVKESCVVTCQAWDSAAETISKNCLAGDNILVDCKFRNKMPFRINEFTIPHLYSRRSG